MTSADEAPQTQPSQSWLKGAEPAHLTFVVGVFALGLACATVYVIEPEAEWVKAWMPAVAGACLVGALTVLAVNVIVETAVKHAEGQRKAALRLAADVELREIQTQVDGFLEKWQTVIGDLSGNLRQALEIEDASGSSFPEGLLARLPSDTFELLSSGWGQPNHARAVADTRWKEVDEIARQIERRTDRVVGWYSAGLNSATPVALGEIQEYVLSVVENMPRSGRVFWFSGDGAHQRFLHAYRRLWADNDPSHNAKREDERKRWIGILGSLRKGHEQRWAEEEMDRAYDNPSLVSVYDLLTPADPRDDFYLRLMMSARAVLDLGCGTGRLLKRAARAQGSGSLRLFQRPLVGVDRQDAMLAEASSGQDGVSYSESLIRWTKGDARTVTVDGQFDLILMTGGTFQELLTDEDIRMVLSTVLSHLSPGGRFAFDLRTSEDDPLRNGKSEAPSAREEAGSVETVRVPQRPIDPDCIEFTTTYTFADDTAAVVSRNLRRFIDHDHLRELLESIGFRIDGWFGDPTNMGLTQELPDDLVIATYLR